MEIVPNFVECPKCGMWYRHSVLMSYSIFKEAECWSDGKCYSDDMPEYAFMPYAKCTKCDHFFWFDDCRQISDFQIRDYQNNKSGDLKDKQLILDFLNANPGFDEDKVNFNLDYPPFEYWDKLAEYLIPDFIKILDDIENLSQEREIYIRTKLRQHLNDLIRFSKYPFFRHLKYGGIRNVFNLRSLKFHIQQQVHNKKLFQQYHPLCTQNLKRLSDLYKQRENEEDGLSRIEIERELGNFEEAKSIINSLKSRESDMNETFIRKSKWRLMIKSSKIFKI